jgi:hypothetical protein
MPRPPIRMSGHPIWQMRTEPNGSVSVVSGFIVWWFVMSYNA